MAFQGLALRISGYPLNSPDELTRILRLAKAGDLSAFEQIILRHERQVLMTAWRLLGNLPDAQDASQEVFLRLFRHLGRIDESRALPAWLYRVTVNVCRDLHRKRPQVRLAELEEVPAGPCGPQQALIEAREERKMVANALKHLPEKERSALVLRDLEGLSTREVAGILGSSEGTVRSQISSARLKLRKLLGRRP